MEHSVNFAKIAAKSPQSFLTKCIFYIRKIVILQFAKTKQNHILSSNHVIFYNVFSVIKPEISKSVEHLTLEGDIHEFAVEAAGRHLAGEVDDESGGLAVLPDTDKGHILLGAGAAELEVLVAGHAVGGDEAREVLHSIELRALVLGHAHKVGADEAVGDVVVGKGEAGCDLAGSDKVRHGIDSETVGPGAMADGRVKHLAVI